MTNSRKKLCSNLPPHSREELANWLGERSDMLLRRIRGKVRDARAGGLGGPHTASLLDEYDILASVCRRVDQAAAQSRLSTDDSAMLWGYVIGITRRVIQSRIRTGGRDMRLYSALSEAEKSGIEEITQADLDRLAPLLRKALTDAEWEMLVLRSRGLDGRGMAVAVGVGEVAVRKRWSRVLALVRKVLNVAVVSPPPKI